MSSDQIDEFMAITSAENAELAQHFIEMAGGDLQTAIALFFEHSGNAQFDAQSRAGYNSTSTDAELAQELQREAYGESQVGGGGGNTDYVRPPDEARHETLADTNIFPSIYGGIGGRFELLRNMPDDIFDDSRPVGIFNQRIDDFSSHSDSDSEYEEEEEDDDFEYHEEQVVEIQDDGEIREYTKMVRRPKHLSKEQRLERLFRPPFDLMSKCDLDSAKSKAVTRQKWVMINIQDSGIFQCQALNRDLWSSRDVKKIVKQNFIFLQYQYESRNAQTYLQFYGIHNKDTLPHIAILDPITGERLKQWNETVPKLEDFIKDVEEFLNSFSLDPNTANPAIKEPTPEVNPTMLTEEQQMEYAIRQSMGLKGCENNDKKQETDLFSSIEAVKHDEPPNTPGATTRIQVRFGNGERIVRRFETAKDTVRSIYEVIKSEVPGFETCRFTLSNHQREDLIDKLNLTIQEAGLQNSSLLLVKDEAE